MKKIFNSNCVLVHFLYMNIGITMNIFKTNYFLTKLICRFIEQTNTGYQQYRQNLALYSTLTISGEDISFHILQRVNTNVLSLLSSDKYTDCHTQSGTPFIIWSAVGLSLTTMMAFRARLPPSVLLNIFDDNLGLEYWIKVCNGTSIK